MPHDANNKRLAVGDEVIMRGKITSLAEGEEYCNVSLESVLGRRPDGNKETMSAINTGVLEVAEPKRIGPPEPRFGKQRVPIRLWRTTKIVAAAVIIGISLDGELTLLNQPGDVRVSVDCGPAWCDHFAPEVGGYFVQYEDGYSSFCPKAAFESRENRPTWLDHFAPPYEGTGKIVNEEAVAPVGHVVNCGCGKVYHTGTDSPQCPDHAPLKPAVETIPTTPEQPVPPTL